LLGRLTGIEGARERLPLGVEGKGGVAL